MASIPVVEENHGAGDESGKGFIRVILADTQAIFRAGLRNFRFNESLVHMLSNVEGLSVPLRSCGEESFDMVVPAMKVNDFNFTEVTKF